MFDKKVSAISFNIGDALQLPHSGTVDNMWSIMQDVIPGVHTASFGP